MELLERHFDAAFDAPDGIKKLRELILTLAIRGKLVSQDPNDPPASELLKEIEADKKRLVKQGKIKEPKPLSPVSLEEVPYSLPNGWEWTRMGDFTEIVRGITFPANEKTKEPGPSKIACLRTTNVQKELEWDDLLFVDRRFMARTSQLIKLNDIVMSMANSRELVGKVAIVRSIPVEESTFGGFLGVIRTYRALPAYVHNVLNSQYARNSLIESASQTTNIANVSLGKLNMFLFPCPPLQEQIRIVEKIDELMARCDTLEKLRAERDANRVVVHAAAVRQLLNVADADEHIQAREFLGQHFGELYTVKENVAELRKAILQLAVMGKLVPQNPNDPPASVLLKQIEAEKRRLVKEGTLKETKQPIPISENEVPYALPLSWKWVRVSDIVEVGTGSTPSTANRDYYTGSIPWYTSSATNRAIAEVPDKCISEDAIRDTNCKVFPAGSLIIALYGQGKTRGQISEIPVAGATNQAIAAMVFFESSLPVKKYLKYFFAKIYEEIRAIAEGAAQPNLNVGKVKATLVPLPPLREQHRIVAQIDQLMNLCDTLEQQIDVANEKRSALLDAMMTQIGGQRCA